LKLRKRKANAKPLPTLPHTLKVTKVPAQKHLAAPTNAFARYWCAVSAKYAPHYISPGLQWPILVLHQKATNQSTVLLAKEHCTNFLQQYINLQQHLLEQQSGKSECHSSGTQAEFSEKEIYSAVTRDFGVLEQDNQKA
jgi:hypothetical protein